MWTAVAAKNPNLISVGDHIYIVICITSLVVFFLLRCVSQYRFRDCMHKGEPSCALLRGVEENEIGEERYASYKRILESIKQSARPDWK